MTDNEGDQAIGDLARQILAGISGQNYLGLSAKSLENVAYHDFAQYRYALEPELLVPPKGDLDALIGDLGWSMAAIDALFVSALKIAIKNKVLLCARISFFGFLLLNSETRDLIADRMIKALVAGGKEVGDPYRILRTLYSLAAQVNGVDQQEILNGLPIIPPNWVGIFYFLGVLGNIVTDAQLQQWWQTMALQAKLRWRKYLLYLKELQEGEVKKGPLEYPFDLYSPYSWNFGLRLIFRQEWRPLGIQRGEIVRTVPLGPKQVEKVSTKIVRRTKVTKTAETLRSVETTTEVSETSKDSTEIVNEASSSFGWHAEAEASVNIGVVSASGSAGAEGSQEQSSRQTNNRLSEAMQKSASKVRNETKTIVSTESESTFEITTASEITNPNEEIPITYVYSKLQRQYEVFTSLAEIHNVIMIAEPIPHPFEVNYEWVRKYDWILAKALLDDSFREALSSISQDSNPHHGRALVDGLKTNMTSITDFFKAFRGDTNLSFENIDIIQGIQKDYNEALQRLQEFKRQKRILDEKRERLYDHIRANILHYCRAIWSHEDPQQRLLRYKKERMEVPVKWDFSGTLGDKTYTGDDDQFIEALLEDVIARETDADAATVFDLKGCFDGVADTDAERYDITELINPEGPIGYFGNYAIYNLRPEYIDSDICKVLQILKTPYLQYKEITLVDDTTDYIPILMDPILKYHMENSPIPSSQDLDKEAMVEYVPALRVLYAAQGEEVLTDPTYDDTFTEYYPEYLFREEMSRTLLLDTNNLIVDIQPGTGTALESFKLAHRGMDVLKALEEKRTLKLDNQRREALLELGEYSAKNWSEAEKVLIFDTGSAGNTQGTGGTGSTKGTIANPEGAIIADQEFMKGVAQGLSELDVETTAQFLKKCQTPESRRSLVKTLEIVDTVVSEADLLKLANIADLMRVPGVGEQEATILEAVGVDTVVELATRDPAELHDALVAYYQDEKVTIPTDEQVSNWIAIAKDLKRMLHY